MGGLEEWKKESEWQWLVEGDIGGGGEGVIAKIRVL